MTEPTQVCKRTVVSTKPVQPDKHHCLSALDRLVEPTRRVMVVYYYRTDRSVAVSAGEVTRKLREGLSEALTHFPAVTGRLVHRGGSDWAVKCNDAGVRMVEARAGGSVEEWLRDVDWEKERRLVHWEEMYHEPYFWSTFYVQLTEFEDGGLAIGLSCSHLLSDPICATMFIKAWADVTLRGKMTCPPLFHQLPAHRPGTAGSNPEDPFTDLCGHFRATTSWPATSPAIAHRTVTLAFSDRMVRSCMESARGHAGGPGPSPFEAVAGLIWVGVSRAKGLSGLLGLTMGLDMRKVLDLADGFFGNCMVYSHIQPSHEEISLSAAAQAIREKTVKFDKERVKDLIGWLEHNDGTEPIQRMLARSDLLCVNLESVDPRWAMFEDGSSPIRTSYYIEPVCEGGQFLILPSPAGDGPSSRAVTVTLPGDEADRLCEDDLILSFAPTVLMGVSTDRA